MIDIENEVFTNISNVLKARFRGIHVTGTYEKVPPKFPTCYIYEADNSVVERTQDSGSNENHAYVMYEVNVYSNLKSGKKTQCKQIASAVDSEMLRMGFTRIFLHPTPNIEDATIYRMTARYTAVVDKNKVIYRR